MWPRVSFAGAVWRRVHLLACLVLGAGLLTSCALVAPPPVVGGPSAPPEGLGWSDTDLAAWHAVSLPGKRPTHYRYETRGPGDATVLRATAEASASVWRRHVGLPSGAPLSLSFSWWVSALPLGARVGHIDLDDAAARVMLAFDGDHGRLSSRNRVLFELAHVLTGERPPYATLVYVWDEQLPPEQVVIHARTDRVRAIVVDSGATGLRSWRLHRRDVVADYTRAFGEPPGALLGLAVMSDTDKTRSRTEVWYGRIGLD